MKKKTFQNIFDRNKLYILIVFFKSFLKRMMKSEMKETKNKTKKLQNQCSLSRIVEKSKTFNFFSYYFLLKLFRELN